MVLMVIVKVLDCQIECQQYKTLYCKKGINGSANLTGGSDTNEDKENETVRAVILSGETKPGSRW